MGVDVKATNAKIWRKDREGKNGTFHNYSVGVSSKNQDGSWTNAYMRVKFSRNSGAPEVIKNGAYCNFEGFMSAESYTDKDGREITNPIIIVMKAEFDDDAEEPREDAFNEAEDSFEKLDDDIPF
jgi:hypothetical protein